MVKYSEEMRQRRREHYLRNRPRILRNRRAYYYKNRERALAYGVAYCKSGRSALSQRRRRMTLEGRASQLVASAKYRAKAANLPFNLDHEWVMARLRLGMCEGSGLQLEITVGTGNGNRHPRGPSIERKNNRLGYTRKNCILVCTQYNIAKNNWPVGDLAVFCLAFVTKHKLMETTRGKAKE